MKDETEFDPYVDAHLAEGHPLDVARALAQADWAASLRPGNEVPTGESGEVSEHVRYSATSPAPGETLKIEVNR